jgi:hypothetical protein
MSYYEVSRLGDSVVCALGPLAEDPEWEIARLDACDAIEALCSAIADITTREDISIMPRCPVGQLTTEAIMGRLPYVVTREMCLAWRAELDRWANAIDRLAAHLDAAEA